MNLIPSPKRGPECPAAGDLEAISAGEAPDARVSEHLSTCAECSGYVAALKEEQAAFVALRPPDQFLRKLERREQAGAAGRSSLGLPRWLRFAVPALAFGLALVVVAPRVLERPPVHDGVNLKGGGLSVVYRRGPKAEPLPVQQDARLSSGDALRFSFDAPRAGQLLILDLDGSGKASVFHPYGKERSGPVAAKSPEFLPGSVVLDDAPGPEWIISVFAPHPIEAAPLLEQLRGQAGAGEVTVRCDDCVVETLRIQKTRAEGP